MRPEDRKAVDARLRELGQNPETVRVVESDCRVLAGGHVELTITGDPRLIAMVPVDKLLDLIYGALAPHVPRTPR
jgi:hypothetical protein